MAGLSRQQKMKVENIAGFKLISFIADNEKAAEWAREDPDLITRVFVAGCQAGLDATIAVMKDSHGIN